MTQGRAYLKLKLKPMNYLTRNYKLIDKNDTRLSISASHKVERHTSTTTRHHISITSTRQRITFTAINKQLQNKGQKKERGPEQQGKELDQMRRMLLGKELDQMRRLLQGKVDLEQGPAAGEGGPRAQTAVE
jgi:hypothetical protein